MFFQKIINLIVHFIDLYSDATFKLETIEYGKFPEDPLVIFINTKTNEHLSRNLEWLFNNKTLLKRFNGKDASLIGYSYGRITNIREINNEAIPYYANTL